MMFNNTQRPQSMLPQPAGQGPQQAPQGAKGGQAMPGMQAGSPAMPGMPAAPTPGAKGGKPTPAGAGMMAGQQAASLPRQFMNKLIPMMRR